MMEVRVNNVNVIQIKIRKVLYLLQFNENSTYLFEKFNHDFLKFKYIKLL